MGTAIKHPVPDWVKPTFIIFDIWALWRSALRVKTWMNGCLTCQRCPTSFQLFTTRGGLTRDVLGWESAHIQLTLLIVYIVSWQQWITNQAWLNLRGVFWVHTYIQDRPVTLSRPFMARHVLQYTVFNGSSCEILWKRNWKTWRNLVWIHQCCWYMKLMLAVHLWICPVYRHRAH